MSELGRLRRELLLEALEDYIGLWEVVWDIQHGLVDVSERELRSRTLDLLRPLLEEGLIQAEDYSGDCTGHPWLLSPAETLARVEREWDALGRAPNIWEICCFNLTEKGKSVARSLA